MENCNVKLVASKITVINISACRFVYTLKRYHWYILVYFQPFLLFQKKNIDYWLTEKCCILTFFIVILGQFFLNNIFNDFFSSLGSIAFVAMKLKLRLIACLIKSAIYPVMETQMNCVVEIGKYTSLQMSRQCINVKYNADF